MAKKKNVKCREVDKSQADRLAHLIIKEAENANWHTAQRTKRVPAPSKGVLVF